MFCIIYGNKNKSICILIILSKHNQADLIWIFEPLWPHKRGASTNLPLGYLAVETGTTYISLHLLKCIFWYNKFDIIAQAGSHEAASSVLYNWA